MEMEEKDPELNVPNWMAFLIVLSCAVSTAIADSKASESHLKVTTPQARFFLASFL